MRPHVHPNENADGGGGPAPEPPPVPRARSGELREHRQDRALASAPRKQAAGVPTYTVHEAAALLSISAEHLYRLIRADAFPALRMRTGGENGRYVIPAQAVRQMLDEATDCGARIDLDERAAATRFNPDRLDRR